jgi:hypothetical protein
MVPLLASTGGGPSERTRRLGASTTARTEPPSLRPELAGWLSMATTWSDRRASRRTFPAGRSSSNATQRSRRETIAGRIPLVASAPRPCERVPLPSATSDLDEDQRSRRRRQAAASAWDPAVRPPPGRHSFSSRQATSEDRSACSDGRSMNVGNAKAAWAAGLGCGGLPRPLVEAGLLAVERDAVAAAGRPTAVDRLRGDYREWLLVERALAPATVHGYETLARRFVAERIASAEKLELGLLTGRTLRGSCCAGRRRACLLSPRPRFRPIRTSARRGAARRAPRTPAGDQAGSRRLRPTVGLTHGAPGARLRP